MRFLGRKILALAAALLLAVPAFSQFYDIGNEPAGVKWKILKSAHFSILYPDSTSVVKLSRFGGNLNGRFGKEAASKYLAMMELAYGVQNDSVRLTYGIPKRFPTVLHPFNAQSNGVSVWAPRQIDFFALPPTSIISTEPWDVSLATHEGRHAWQMAHFNRGIFKVLYWFAGDQVIGSASSIYPSVWMLEGDAVVAETEMSRGGRGRSAAFLSRSLRCIIPDSSANLTNYFYGKQRSWDRWRLGSLKAFSPSAYDVGYMINSLARYRSKDVNLTHKILNYEVNHFLSANVVASAFKAGSGKTHRKYVAEDELRNFMELNSNKEFINLLNNLRSENNYSPESLNANPLARSGEKRGYFTIYKAPVEIGKDSVVAVVEGYGTSPYLVLMTKENGEWKHKILTYFEGTENFYYHDGVLWKSEIRSNSRWGQIKRSIIAGYNIKEKEDIDVIGEFTSREGGYLNEPAVVMVDGRPVMYAITYDPSTMHASSNITPIYYLDNENEDVSSLPEYPVEGQATSFTSVGKEIIYTVVTDEGLALKKAWKDGGKYFTRNLIEPSYHTISKLKSKGNEVFFVTDYFGNTNLCRMDVTDCKMRLASLADNIDNFYVSDCEDDVVYISRGVGDKGCFPFKEKLVSVDVAPGLEFTYPLAEELSRQYKEKWNEPIAEEKIEAEVNSYAEEDYSRIAHAFRIHSWYPAYTQLTGETSGNEFVEENGLGVTFYSQNTLGTARGMAAYSYQRASRLGTPTRNLHAAHAAFSYSGWYPVIEAEAHFNDKAMISNNKYSFRSQVTISVPQEFDLFKSELEVEPYIAWTYRNDESIPEVNFNRVTFRQIERNNFIAGLNILNTMDMARSQIYPRLGIGASLAGMFNMDGGSNFGNVYAGILYGYLPGLGFNQGLRLSAAYQRQDVEGKLLWMDNILSMPRGFTEDFYGRNYFRATADYAIPIYLGDVSLGFFAYLKQLKVIPFIDYGRVEIPHTISQFNNTMVWNWHNRFSYGADVTIVGNFFRIGFPLEIGIRYARTNKPGDVGNATPAIYDGNGRKDYIGLLFGISFR